MKETITPAADQTKRLGDCPSAESTSDQHILKRTAVWTWRHLLLKKADHPATHLVGKSKTRFLLVHVVLCLALVGPILATPFIMPQTAWAAPAHLARSAATHQISAEPNKDCPEFAGICFLVRFIPLMIEGFKVFFAILKNDPIGWIVCFMTAGTLPCPTVSDAPWAFDCPGVDQAYMDKQIADRKQNLDDYYNFNGDDTNINHNSSSSINPDPETLYQKALQGSDTRADWLSGDVTWGDDNKAGPYPSGHLIYTYPQDTIERKGVQKLTSLSMGLGIVLIGPLFFLVGFQILLAGLKPGSEKAVANAMEGLGRVLLAAAIVGVSYYVVQLLFTLLNTANHAVIELHKNMPYETSQTTINDKAAVSYTFPGDTLESFRGVVMPMSLWGCAMDDFLGLMATRVANGIGSGLPLIGGVLGLTGRIVEISELIKLVGEFGLLILSVTLWAQAVARLFLINYYIVMAPLAFACWGLPGHTGSGGALGNHVIRVWFKGFLQLLFVQTIQILTLTTLPSLLPDFGPMQFPQGGYNVLQSLLVQLPPIITAMGAVSAPKILMGMGPMNTIVQAGQLAGKAVAAAGAAISGMVKR